MHQEHHEDEQEFSFKTLFVPLTTLKAIHWIIFIGLVVYANMLFNGFVWDDLPQYVNKTITHSILNFPQILTDKETLYYRPFAALVFALIYTFVGATPFFYHLIELVLHISIAIMLFLFFKKFASNILSFFMSLFFLIHPINVEAVAYISALQTILSVFFGFLVFFLIENKKIASLYKYFLIALFLLFSVLSKESGWLFFAIIPIYMILNNNVHYKRKDYLNFFVVCLIAGITYASLAHPFITQINEPGTRIAPIPIPIWHADLTIRVLTLPKIIYYYLYTLLFPINLGITQQWLVIQIDFSNFIFPLFIDCAFFAGILLAGIYLARKEKKVLGHFCFFAIFFLLSFAIAWQIIPLDMTVADRWFYMPMIGLLGICVVLLNALKLTSDVLKRLLLTLAVILILGYSIRTVIRNEDWKDGITLYSHDRFVSSQSFDIYNLLGNSYLSLHQYDKAETYLKKSLTFGPDYWITWEGLGESYANTGHIKEAINAFSKAIAINDRYYPAYLNLVKVSYYTNRLSETNDFLVTKALIKYPYDPYFWSVKAAIDYRLGDKQKGVMEMQKAYDLSKQPFYLNFLKLMNDNQDISSIH